MKGLSIVPSNKTDGTGERHFVVPRAAGGFVSVAAVVGGELEAGTSFDALYELVVLQDGADVTRSAAVVDGQKLYVKTDTAGHYVVQVRTREAKPAVVTRLNVWVVWDTIELEKTGSINAEYDYKMTVDGHEHQPATFIDAGYASYHTILPPSIITDSDRPDMSGKNTTDVPGATLHHVLRTDRTLAQGVASKWDPSQQIRAKFINPNGVSAKYFGDGFLPDTFYPNDPLVGNDDIFTTETGSIDPYAHHGIVSILDTAGCGVADQGGNIGDTWEWRVQALDFGRAEIAGVWYMISDPVYWRVHFKFKKVGGEHQWISNMTDADAAKDNANY